MKRLVLPLALVSVGLTQLEANSDITVKYAEYILPTFMGMIIAILLFLFLSVRYKVMLHKRNKIVSEQEEKIKFLRQVTAENQSHQITQSHETEKEILALKHTIESLEQQAKEGTKNQVVAKLEAQQSKRAKLMERAGITL